jgi:hypothetical protein
MRVVEKIPLRKGITLFFIPAPPPPEKAKEVKLPEGKTPLDYLPQTGPDASKLPELSWKTKSRC